MLTSDAQLEKPPHDQLIWRFMTLEKLLDLLQSQRLFFAPLRSMKDPFEGHMPRENRAWLLEQIGDQLVGSGFAEGDIYKFLREIQFINCWHASTDESAAMWSLYSGCVAIRTQFDTLQDCLAATNLPITLGMVRYLDFSQLGTAPKPPSVRITHLKRRSFEHEKELRASICCPHRVHNEPLSGLPVPIDCKKLIRDVVVDPEAPSWISSVVQDVVKKYGFSFEVKRSDLYTLV